MIKPHTSYAPNTKNILVMDKTLEEKMAKKCDIFYISQGKPRCRYFYSLDFEIDHCVDSHISWSKITKMCSPFLYLAHT